jgi:hypothetical protein
MAEPAVISRGSTTQKRRFPLTVARDPHHCARYSVRELQNEDKSDPNAGYLKVNAGDWLPFHFDPRSPKVKRRKYFVG